MQTFSKIILTLLVTAWFAGCSQVQENENSDEKAIRNIVQSYQDAYNQQDAAKLTAYWAPDAIYINPITGQFAEGREAIENLFKEKFAQTKKRHLEIAINRIEFLNANEAIENGVMKVNVGDQAAQKVAYEAKYIKENSKWLLKSFNEIELQEPSSNFDQLKDLAWLIGKWEDSDDNVDIFFDNQWDKYKNFITQYFKMEIYGQEDIEGKQIIVWDPVKRVVRSWIFDSDGGFGEGTWQKMDKSWYATMHFTLGDGRVASSINVYTPVDDHSYTFASVEREIDGEILPDMNPVIVEKAE